MPAMPPLMPPPVPPKIEARVPSLSPSTPAVLPPQNTAPPPLDVQSHAPSVPPTAPSKKLPVNNGPVSVPVAPGMYRPWLFLWWFFCELFQSSCVFCFSLASLYTVPVATPSRNVAPISPVINSSRPETSPSSSHQRNAPDNKVPIPEPNSPGI